MSKGENFLQLILGLGSVFVVMCALLYGTANAQVMTGWKPIAIPGFPGGSPSVPVIPYQERDLYNESGGVFTLSPRLRI